MNSPISILDPNNLKVTSLSHLEINLNPPHPVNKDVVMQSPIRAVKNSRYMDRLAALPRCPNLVR
jgi:hypothetical protein